ncbi:MAG: hypothetical protein C3F13_09475 [Anaerolineales bacterium]|nr:MAG: hypothetical protein C3F13_09475 [Anaerolineales bacterium]
MKRLIYLSILIIFLLTISTPINASAQSTITVSQDRIVSNFPDKLTFQLNASSTAKIEKIKLLYHTNGATCQSSVAQRAIELTPATTQDVQWDWDFTLSGVLPPGAEVYWQWEISDAVGNTLLTDEQSYLVDDPRKDWTLLAEDQVNLQWYRGDRTFGQTLLGIAIRSLERMANNAGVRPDGQIWLTIYPSTDELLEVDIHASEWAGGIAYPEFNSTIMAIAPGEADWASSVIPHELAHLVTEAVVFNCLGMWLPTWLSEGLATYAEGETSEYYQDIITTALEQDSLPPLRTLESGFSSISAEANLSYAQSGMVVTYMIDTYGSEQMSDLLNSIKSGNKIDKALMAVYGKNTDGIEAEWRISLGYEAQPTQVSSNTARTAVPTMALWTSAVRPSSTPTSSPSFTSTPIPPSATALPQESPTVAAVAVEQLPPDVASSQGIKSAYIITIAAVAAVLAAAVTILLVILFKKRRQSP